MEASFSGISKVYTYPRPTVDCPDITFIQVESLWFKSSYIEASEYLCQESIIN
jgi:hypothetical protein